MALLGLLKVSTHIVLLNLDYILHPAALSFLLFYILKSLVFDPSVTVLFNLSIVFFISVDRRDLDDLQALYSTALTPNPTPPNPSLTPTLRFVKAFCFVILVIVTAIQANGDYEQAAMTIVCRNFAILAMLGGIAGALYTVFTICSLEKYGPIVEERRGSGPVSKLIRWSIYFVGPGAAAPAWVAFLIGQSFPPVIMWRWVSAGVSVGFLPLFFVCVMSTHAALFLSCRSHHKQSSSAVDNVTDFYVSVDEQPTT